MIGRSLVVVEQRDGVITPGQLGVLASARAVSGSVEVLVFGPPTSDAVDLLGQHGAQVIHVAAGNAVTTSMALPRVELIGHLQSQQPFDAILLENSSIAADVAGAIAVRLNAGVNWDLVDLVVRDGELIGSRLALQDSVALQVGWTGTPRIAVFRAGHLDPVPLDTWDQPMIREVNVALSLRAGAVRVLRRIAGDANHSGLDSADVVVAGGRGLGGPENIALLEDLAAALGGAVGVSMPVVDKGWYPYSHQVGQTGRTVRPKLYIACGISGAIQHRVGMAKSGTIIAINTDPTAPIFAICDFGLVGDLTQVVPRLTALLRRADAGR